MQKDFIQGTNGVDYVVRTIDITSLPTFEGEAYKKVTVADYALWVWIQPAYEACDKWAIRLDESIFYYADSEFIKADPTDEELLDYLREHLLQMRRFKAVRQPVALDFYAITLDEQGQKRIEILGYTYHGDQWKNIDMRSDSILLSEFVDGMEQSDDYVGEIFMESRQYEDDVTDEACCEYINTFFDGKGADNYLQFEDVTIDTPVGNYVNESK